MPVASDLDAFNLALLDVPEGMNRSPAHVLNGIGRQRVGDGGARRENPFSLRGARPCHPDIERPPRSRRSCSKVIKHFCGRGLHAIYRVADEPFAPTHLPVWI